MASLISAVGSDTYGGLSGFKRPVQGNPTRVPSNLPANRGTPNKPGANIKTPAIKSSASRNNRGTNVQIPYARVVPTEFPGTMGRLAPGDVAFVSKTRPGVPGYAHARESRLLGVDALNKFMGPNYWRTTLDDGKTHRYVLVDSPNPADDWRAVPTLQEWTVDGVVLSNEDKESFYSTDASKRDGQLYNIAIQGMTMVNNGYVEENQNWDELSRQQQGQVARQTHLFAPGYMDHRVEVFGQDKMQVDQEWDFAADYQGPQYHLYPMQMFDRDIRPMNDCFIGLVCTRYKLAPDDVALLNNFAAAETSIGKAKSEGNGPGLVAAQTTYEELRKDPGLKLAVRAKTAYDKMDWWDDEKSEVKNAADGRKAPKDNFCSFRYALFTSRQAWDLDTDVDTMAPLGEPTVRTKRQRLGKDPFDNVEVRARDFQGMVGAWHVGKVLDMKAGKMPYFEGGPVETGYRVTLNVDIGWCDWRNLRRQFSPVDSAMQFGENLVTKWESTATDDQKDTQEADLATVLQWPTVWSGEAKTALAKGTPEAYGANVNAPVPNASLQQALLDPNGPKAESILKKFDTNEELKKERLAYTKRFYKLKGTELPSEEADEDPLPYVLFDAAASRVNALKTLPVLRPDASHEDHLQRATLAFQNIKALIGSATAEGVGLRSVPRRVAGVEAYVVASGTSSGAGSSGIAHAAAPAAPGALVAPSAPLRRRAGNTPEPSPDRTGTVASIGGAASPSLGAQASSTAGPALPPVLEAPTAPAGGAQRKRRANPTDDVFSNIFGGADATSAPMQPLNPAHRAEGGTSGASTGRSYQRRGKDKK